VQREQLFAALFDHSVPMGDLTYLITMPQLDWGVVVVFMWSVVSHIALKLNTGNCQDQKSAQLLV